MRSPLKYLVVVLAVLVTVSTATAQTFTGGLRGAVKDANGVIPGVTVELVNEATNVARDVVSNDQGLYNFAAVAPGVYTIKASLTGFKSYEQKGVRIAAQQFVTIDVSMEVGALQETITVTGEAPLIDTSTASTGGVINTEQLNTLPSGGRSAFLFAVTVPTVVASGDSQFNRQQDQTNASLLSLGGGTRRGNNYLIDGVPVTDLRNRASANPTIEGLEDVAVQVHTYDAETGRTGGGIFNTATKGGANSFAGSGFYQTRPRWGMSNNFFSELANQPLPETYFHLGGGGFGGPDHQEPHVLLVRDGRLRLEHHQKWLGALPDHARAQRRLLADVRFGRPPGRDLRPGSRAMPTAPAARRSRATSSRRTASTRWAATW